MVIPASRGIVLTCNNRWRVAVLALALLVPLVRFGPRYVMPKTPWTDTVMDVDSQHAAEFINARKHPGDTLFVWGYRPDLYVYTRLIPPEKFADSQPLDGVPADRHLESSQPSTDIAAQANREVLIRSQPTFVVDGLGLLNPALQPQRFPDLANWLKQYRLVDQTNLCRIYAREK